VKLVEMLIRWCNGERKVWAVVHTPAVADEDRRQLHRELIALKAERTALINTIKGLLAGLGLAATVDEDFPANFKELRQWNGLGVPPELSSRLLRVFERWQLVGRQIQALEQERTQRIRKDEHRAVEQVRWLLNLKGIGENGAWLLVGEFFSWRGFQNRRELASLAGLTPTPYDSGETRREQGISKAGNRRVRWMMVQLAWGWLQYQPESELSQWYQRRFAAGNVRLRKIGIVALARKLLIALWKYLETGVPPAGAEVVGWDQKPKFACASLVSKAS
jgi:transposase